MGTDRPGSAEVRRLLGDLPDRQVAAVLATGATTAELEAAALWLAGADDVLGEARRPLDGAAGRVAEIVARDEPWQEPDRG